jgi:hypothetical protein
MKRPMSELVVATSAPVGTAGLRCPPVVSCPSAVGRNPSAGGGSVPVSEVDADPALESSMSAGAKTCSAM